jgi:hypothetical protein
LTPGSFLAKGTHGSGGEPTRHCTGLEMNRSSEHQRGIEGAWADLRAHLADDASRDMRAAFDQLEKRRGRMMTLFAAGKEGL